MKIFKRKHFQALIYSIFLALPLLSVLGRCVYTIFNKNAKDSYYGETINEIEYTQITKLQDLKTGNEYQVNLSTLSNNGNLYSSENRIYYTDISNIIGTNLSGFNFDEVNSFAFYTYETTTTAVYFYYDTTYKFNLNTNNLQSFEFVYLESRQTNNKLDNLLNSYSFINHITYNEYSYLDNAFEYSIDRFVSDNDYGIFDFFQWFSTFFLSNTSINNLYIHFINWYLNYVLYVSLGYLIFSVLFWFVNFFRRLVEDTQNINVGGM